MAGKQAAIVIGSGGVKTAAALGLWRTLQAAGLRPCMAVCASGGSLYAAAIALGYFVEQAEQLTIDLWQSHLMNGYTANLRAPLSGESRFGEHSGLIDDGLHIERLHNAFGERALDDARLPLHIVSTDLLGLMES